jgi:AraC-like DNA-binding protein
MTDIIRSGALWGYMQLTQHMAPDAAALLAQAGLTPEDLDNTDAYLPRPAVVALLELTATRLRCPDFGMQLAKMQDVNILGALAFAIRNAANVRQSIAAASRHVHYQARQGILSIEPVAGSRDERIVFRAPYLKQGARQKTEHAICLFCRVFSHLTAGRAHPRRITFTHDALLPAAAYAKHFEGVTPEFSAEADCVFMDKDTLALPMAGANPRLQALVETYLESQSPRPDVSIENRTYAALAQVMRFGPASIEDVADLLRLHPRTLQRRLSEGGATFERLRDEIRKDMAERHLSDARVPLSEVAAVLGYANQSALARSCVRWFGRSPKVVRDQLRNGDRRPVERVIPHCPP